ncbi:serine/threonine-protein kinase [Nocardiopsis aegyptia]|uniref:non-specific serine/threonine protein kinase n=1 Tax=Nocardiopsis aegyptia TaxID=220378 RepID=A0A7Z0ET48_9ACTN|nr:serine/threonine-protein kinase [Nocardiopsis aegyptia]NYJ37777.1 serine/threonine-protein kinase PknG [Nocardiopsis aegyptia]
MDESGQGAACADPTCAGTIDDEGYCDQCGLRREEPPAPPGPAPGTPGATPVTPGPAPAAPGAAPVPSVPGSAAPDAAPVARGPAGAFPGDSASRPSSAYGSGPASTGTGPTGGRGRSSVGVLGEGLSELPPIPYQDPADVVMRDPEVPEERRFCGSCHAPVGRSKNGRPGRQTGFCPDDGNPYSFVPTLRPGDLVAGQYRIEGAIAYGGMGWIYLAADQNLDGQWVVLKGLLDSSDEYAQEAAEAERRFLISVDHPNIVKIINFVQHADTTTGAVHRYLVMEYIGGGSLQKMLREHLESTGQGLPPRQAIPYTLEILRALDHLHSQGMLFCDLKPANVVQVEHRLKLIDLGGVRLMDDSASPKYGTRGYSAPEFAEIATVRTDLYTVGRTLAVLCFPFRLTRRENGELVDNPLPGTDAPEYEALHRLLLRATAADPADRFASATEMADQLTGVLREIRAFQDGIPYPAPSTIFGPERHVVGSELASSATRLFDPLDPALAAACLPLPAADPNDPAAAALTGLVMPTSEQMLALLDALPPSPEGLLARCRILAQSAHPGTAAALDEAAAQLPGDWRVDWYTAVGHLAGGGADRAARLFDDLVSHLPGEAAPKLALATALECAGRTEEAARWYRTVWSTDHAWTGAAFGYARTRRDRVEVLDQVPASSAFHTAAQLALVAHALRGTGDTGGRGDRGPGSGAPPAGAAITAAAHRLDALPDQGGAVGRALAADLLEAALSCLAEGGSLPEADLLGAPASPRALRTDLDRRYRELARTQPRGPGRRLLVDRANAVRPRSLT